MKIEDKLFDIVEDLNADAYVNMLDGKNGHPSDDISPFELSSTGFSSVVLFLGLCVWNTEDDSEWDDNDDPVNIRSVIKARSKKYIESIVKSVK